MTTYNIIILCIACLALCILIIRFVKYMLSDEDLTAESLEQFLQSIDIEYTITVGKDEVKYDAPDLHLYFIFDKDGKFKYFD